VSSREFAYHHGWIEEQDVSKVLKMCGVKWDILRRLKGQKVLAVKYGFEVAPRLRVAYTLQEPGHSP
jgi:hypothetical protein